VDPFALVIRGVNARRRARGRDAILRELREGGV
jgi:hypothetical protein